METAQKIQQLEAEKQQLIQQSVLQENNLNGLRQQAAQVEGRLIELRLIQKDNPVEQENAEEPEADEPKKRKYKKRQKKQKLKYNSHTPKRTHSGRIAPKKKRLFSEEVDAFIEKNWESHADKKLRELIGVKFKVWYDSEQLRAHRRQLGCISKKKGRRPEVSYADDDGDELLDALDED